MKKLILTMALTLAVVCGLQAQTVHRYDAKLDGRIPVTIALQETNSGIVAANKYYQEVLFDKDGHTTFFFEKMNADETRYYYSANGLVHEIVKGQRQMDDVFALRLATDLKDAFNKRMNRNYETPPYEETDNFRRRSRDADCLRQQDQERGN